MKPTLSQIAKCMLLAGDGEYELARTARALYPGALGEAIVELSIANTVSGASLLNPAAITSEFIAALRPATVLGKLQHRTLPFNVHSPFWPAAPEFDFVGEGAPLQHAVLELTDAGNLPRRKIGGMFVATRELMLAPDSERVFEQDLRAGLIRATDRRLLDPTSDETTARPASITHGVEPIDAAGVVTPAELDEVLAALVGRLVAAGSLLEDAVLVTGTRDAVGISFLRDEAGALAYPAVNAKGGVLAGLPLLTSAAPELAGLIVAVDPAELFVADDGEIELLLARSANVQIGAEVKNTFELALLALRAYRYINWTLRRSGFVQYAANLALPLPPLEDETS